MFGWFKSDTPELSVEEKNEIIREHNSLLQERTSLIEEEITFSDSVDEEVIEVNRCIKIWNSGLIAPSAREELYLELTEMESSLIEHQKEQREMLDKIEEISGKINTLKEQIDEW